MLIAAKIGLTALCIGAGFSGGAFSPSLLIGSLIGVLFWTLAAGPGGVPDSGVAIYAISGMMAFASAVIGAPLTCILIVFELTRNYDVTIAAMVAVVFSNLVSHRAFGRSLFDVQLARRGIDFSLGRDHARLAALPVVDFLSTDAVTAESADSPAAVSQRLEARQWREAFVLDPDGRLLGVFNRGIRPGDTARSGLRGAGTARLSRGHGPCRRDAGAARFRRRRRACHLPADGALYRCRLRGGSRGGLAGRSCRPQKGRECVDLTCGGFARCSPPPPPGLSRPTS